MGVMDPVAHIPASKRLQLVSGRFNRTLAEDIANHLGVELLEPNIAKFANGELRCRFQDSIRGNDLFIFQTHCETEFGSLNDAIMVVAFAPIVGLLLGLSAIAVPWDTLVLSVVLYIVVPVAIAQVARSTVIARGGEAALERMLNFLKPLSLAALLATLVLLFGFQGDQIIAQPLVIVLLAVPILIQVYLNSGIAYLLNRWTGEAHCVAAPSALIGASNFFELAVAAAISLFGFDSGAALATVVGVLIEVPVMLSVVRIVNATRGWYERAPAVRKSPPYPAGGLRDP